MDSTGIQVLRQVIRRSRNDGSLVGLSELRAQSLAAFDRAGVLDQLDDECPGSVEEALAFVRDAGCLVP